MRVARDVHPGNVMVAGWATAVVAPEKLKAVLIDFGNVRGHI